MKHFACWCWQSFVVLFLTISLVAVAGCKERLKSGEVQDEAMRAGFPLEKIRVADEDYFRDMDQNADANGNVRRIALSPAEVRGRNSWIVWTAGNDRYQDHLTLLTFGNLDLLKTLSSHPSLKFSRDNRWYYLGLVNEPCFDKATEGDRERFGLWLDKRRADCPPDPFENEQNYPGARIGARGKTVPVGTSRCMARATCAGWTPRCFPRFRASSFKDQVEDFRGMAIKLFDVQGEKLPVPSTASGPEERYTQDFMFIAHNTFFAGNPLHFHDFFAACRAGGYSCDPRAGTFGNWPLIWHLLTHPHGAFNAVAGRRTYRAIEEIRWFSVAPFELGNKDTLVKYGAFPAEGEEIPWDDFGTSPHYLTERLSETLDPRTGKGIKLDFRVQFRTKPDKQPIDDTLVAWEPADSPWHKVATIDIYPQEFDIPAQWEFCQNISFNPWHSLVEHRPVGDLNRARRDVMHAMQMVRLRHNGRSPIEPTGNERF